MTNLQTIELTKITKQFKLNGINTFLKSLEAKYEASTTDLQRANIESTYKLERGKKATLEDELFSLDLMEIRNNANK